MTVYKFITIFFDYFSDLPVCSYIFWTEWVSAETDVILVQFLNKPFPTELIVGDSVTIDNSPQFSNTLEPRDIIPEPVMLTEPRLPHPMKAWLPILVMDDDKIELISVP